MATKEFISLDGLAKYDQLIKQYIGEENVSSIKSISVSGNTVSFYRTADTTGTAYATINLPDTSNFIEKIASATGGKIVTSTATGEVAESTLSISDVTDSVAATDGFNAQNTIADAIDAIADDSEVTITEAQTPTTGYLKTYVVAQGGTEIGRIDIPKDLVVTSGEIVVNPTGQPAGTYLKLTIVNQTNPVYINVADLADVYTAQQSAAQVQLVISATNEISATIVAGSVTATELASNAVTTAKIADGNVTKVKLAQGVQDSLDLADSAVQSVVEGATNGTVAVDGTDVAVHGLGSAAYTASTAYEAAGSIATAIGALDATKSQTAGADGLALSITETDGKITSISGSIAAETYEPYGAAASAIAGLDASVSHAAGTDGLALSVTEVDGKVTAISGSIAANTYDAYGAASTAESNANAYTDAATAPVAISDIEALFS